MAISNIRAVWLFVFAIIQLLAGSAYADRVVSIDVEGTQLKVSLEGGQVLRSPELVGTVLSLPFPDGSTKRVLIEQVEKDPKHQDGDILLHRLLVEESPNSWTELCSPDAAGARWAFPLWGRWNSEGLHTSESGFSLICASGAVGKCVLFGYKPWEKATDGELLEVYHAACVKAVRADYCGNRGTTRDGQLIDIFDTLGVQHRDMSQSTAAMPFEAAFSEMGAVCVAHTRVPENMTLNALAAECPRLAGHLGPHACIESDAIRGRYGHAMIFTRSPVEEQRRPPPQVQLRQE